VIAQLGVDEPGNHSKNHLSCPGTEEKTRFIPSNPVIIISPSHQTLGPLNLSLEVQEFQTEDDLKIVMMMDRGLKDKELQKVLKQGHFEIVGHKIKLN
jgi:hypothetical protein